MKKPAIGISLYMVCLPRLFAKWLLPQITIGFKSYIPILLFHSTLLSLVVFSALLILLYIATRVPFTFFYFYPNFRSSVELKSCPGSDLSLWPNFLCYVVCRRNLVTSWRLEACRNACYGRVAHELCQPLCCALKHIAYRVNRALDAWLIKENRHGQ